MHVEVAVDVGALPEPPPDLRLTGGVVPPPHEPPIDGLDVIGHRAPGPRLAAPRGGRAKALPEGGIGAESLQLGGECQRIADRKEEPALALPDELPIELEIGGHRYGARRE